MTLHLTGIGELALVDVIGKALLEAANPRHATYARPDFVDLRVSAISERGHSAAELVDRAIAALSPRLDPFVFGRNDDDWSVVLARRLGSRRVATIEVGTGGYLAMLLGASPFLLHAEQDVATDADAATLAATCCRRVGADIGLAAVAREAGDDMQVEIGLSQRRHRDERHADGLPRRRRRTTTLSQRRHHRTLEPLGPPVRVARNLSPPS